LTGERVLRRLAAILAADVVGYSSLMGRDEHGTLVRLKAHRQERLEPVLTRHSGRLVKLTGDGALVEFASAVDALSAAIEFQQAMAEANREQPAETAIVFRIGLHLGDLIVDGDDLYGDGVNVAARLEGEAPAGGILISRNVRDAVTGRLKATFEDLGGLSLKNIERPVRAFRVGWDPAAWSGPAFAPEQALTSGARPALALPDKPSIAVLPLQNMGGDPEQEYFADGVMEDLITGLSRIRWLFVIARNSSFVYKGRSVDVKQAGRELGVRYLLEGGVRRAGNRVRITARLIDAEASVHLWTERYDRELDDIFALQDEITMSVIGAIEPNLRKAEIERVSRKRPDSLDAYDLVLRAMPSVYSHIAQDALAAIPLLEKALELDPGYALAHALLAWCYHFRFSRAGLREVDRLSAVHHARAAIAGGDDASALGMAAFVISLDDHDHATAVSLFDRALTLSNSNIFALACSALVLSWMGQSSLAIERAQRALRFSPFDFLNYLSYNALAISYFHTKRYDDAHEASRSSVQLNPRFSVSHAFLTAILIRLGREDEAKIEAQRVVALDPTFTIRRFSVTVDIEPAVFMPLADAWRAAGLPAE
jgi:adenylate cyclase